MKNRNVKVGDYVKQGDVIGWGGMTGNTGGPHVCYRFWKNGRQVDPFRQKRPEAEPNSDSLKVEYLEFIKPIKLQLDAISFPNEVDLIKIDSMEVLDNQILVEEDLITE
jgi:murein DD-endopeptidase MepM/ murein hydrolase activator NlpD